jgi:hypothetical protein
MAKQADLPSGRVASPKQELTYRPVLDWPSSIFIQNVIAHLKTHAQPETCDLLYRNRIPKTTKFRIVQRIELGGRKRPDGDLAPCPMCTTNRFLSGALVYLPDMLCCAVIGHCCASKEARDEAEREYRWRTRRDHEQSLLLETLPIVPKRLEALGKLRPAAEEARRIYRKFRKDVPTVHGHLREIRYRRGGYLVVTELVEGDKENDIQTHGPRGLGRQGAEQTKEIEFGTIIGQTAVIKDYNPVRELDQAIRLLSSLELTPTEDLALDFIVSMDEKQRRAAVAIIEGADAARSKLVGRLHDFSKFFSKENIELIHDYGNYPNNPMRIDASFDLVRGQRRVSINHYEERFLVLIGSQLFDINFEWP